jgi:hypothetical protein
VSRAVQALEKLRGALARVLSSSLPPSPRRVLMAALVEGFRERCPRAGVGAVEGLRHHMPQQLARAQLPGGA